MNNLFLAATLQSGDYIGFTFFLGSMAMLAATVFFFVERSNVSAEWKMSMTVSGLITGIAAVHYYYMRDVWVGSGESRTVFRYIDWLLTVPLQMVEFYLILAAITAVSGGVFWRLFIGSVVMLLGGFLGEAGYMNAMAGFIIGMAGWIYILYEVFKGEAAQVNAASANASCQKAFGAMKMIVSVGWSIYPLGYAFGYLGGAVDANTLNVVYNIADFVNKIAFGLVIWAAAVADSE